MSYSHGRTRRNLEVAVQDTDSVQRGMFGAKLKTS
jgi:hypothetical protein